MGRGGSPGHGGEDGQESRDDRPELFAEVTDTIREAARIPQDRRLAPENVQRACEYGLG